jgi:hypothetical protein
VNTLVVLGFDVSGIGLYGLHTGIQGRDRQNQALERQNLLAQRSPGEARQAGGELARWDAIGIRWQPRRARVGPGVIPSGAASEEVPAGAFGASCVSSAPSRKKNEVMSAILVLCAEVTRGGSDLVNGKFRGAT